MRASRAFLSAVCFAAGHAGPAQALELGDKLPYAQMEQKLSQEGQKEMCSAITVLKANGVEKLLDVKITLDSKGTGLVLLSDPDKTIEKVYRKFTNTETYAPQAFVIPKKIPSDSPLSQQLKRIKDMGDGVILHGNSLGKSDQLAGTVTLTFNVGANRDEQGRMGIFTVSVQGELERDRTIIPINASCPGLDSFRKK